MACRLSGFNLLNHYFLSKLSSSLPLFCLFCIFCRPYLFWMKLLGWHLMCLIHTIHLDLSILHLVILKKQWDFIQLQHALCQKIHPCGEFFLTGTSKLFIYGITVYCTMILWSKMWKMFSLWFRFYWIIIVYMGVCIIIDVCVPNRMLPLILVGFNFQPEVKVGDCNEYCVRLCSIWTCYAKVELCQIWISIPYIGN